MMTLPLVLRGDARPFVVVGAGQVAARKIRTLVQAGATVRVIAPKLHADIQALAAQIEIDEREAQPDESFPAQSWVVLATSDKNLNAKLAQQAKAQGAWVCRVDEPEHNDFSFPAVIDRSPLLITVSTQGASPALTRHVKQRIEAFLPSDYSKLATYVENLRERIKARLPLAQRAVFWQRWMNSAAPEMFLSRKLDQAESLTQSLLDGQEQQGEVWLVGAGPGDPDLLTFRALRLIQNAEVVYYDRLVSPRILEFIAPTAQKFYVGKEQSLHSVPQSGINELLAQSALEGKKVLRLKGGDPFIFGRGGEEIEHLAEQGIPFQVVPGITAASGCAAYAGIPLTHRNHAQSVRFVTGHLKDDSCDLPWQELVHPNQTLAIYMGLSGLPHICAQLIQHGMPADTPIALVEKGTLPEQKVHVKTLKTMPDYVASHAISAPTLTIVGSVVSLYDRLKWR